MKVITEKELILKHLDNCLETLKNFDYENKEDVDMMKEYISHNILLAKRLIKNKEYWL
jgi:hypothetical protein